MTLQARAFQVAFSRVFHDVNFAGIPPRTLTLALVPGGVVNGDKVGVMAAGLRVVLESRSNGVSLDPSELRRILDDFAGFLEAAGAL